MSPLTRRAALLSCFSLAACAAAPAADDPAARLAALETQAGGRLGAAVLDVATGRLVGWRADERFGLCSVFKLALAGVVLAEADAGRLSLDEAIAITPEDLVPHHPDTGQALAQGRAMTIAELAESGQRTSDNVSANLLLRRLGGPEAFTAKLRALGDPVTRLDRWEPDMNDVGPGDARDTTSPAASARLVARLCTGDALSPRSRDRLVGWMIATRTGWRRLRAGFPPAWLAGDKTGTAIGAGIINRYNDVAIAWPPHRGPIVVSAFYESPARAERMRPEDEAVLAEVGRIAAMGV